MVTNRYSMCDKRPAQQIESLGSVHLYVSGSLVSVENLIVREGQQPSNADKSA